MDTKAKPVAKPAESADGGAARPDAPNAVPPAVLILGAGPRLTLTIARSLKRRGVKVIVSPVSQAEDVIPSRAIDRFVTLPDNASGPDEFLQALLALIRSENIELIMPTGDGAMAILGQHYNALKNETRLGCPTPDVMEAVLNKEITLDAARRCGIPAPLSLPVADASEAKSASHKLTFPVIAKPTVRKGASPFKVRYFKTSEAYMASAEAEPELWQDVLVQEYCPGYGVGIGTLLHDGEPMALFQHRRIKELPYSGGVSVMAVAEEPDPGIRQAALDLLREIGWYGIAMVEFRYDPASGKFWLMEINGRYWGSLFVAAKAGLDFPYYEWQLAHGQKPEPPERYAVGTKARWLSGDIMRLVGILSGPQLGFNRPSPLREILLFFLHFSPHIRHAVWSVADPKPAIWECWETLKPLITRAVKKIAKLVLPSFVLEQLSIYRSLGSRRKHFLRSQLKRLFRPSSALCRIGQRPVRSVLFVCLGNIMRSPMSAEILKRELPPDMARDMSITSAGLWRGLDPQNPRRSPEEVQMVAKEFAVSLEAHRSQPVTDALVAKQDLIFVMDYENEATMLDRFPECRDRLYLLGACISKVPVRQYEIEDPWGGGKDTIRVAFRTIQDRVSGLAKLLT